MPNIRDVAAESGFSIATVSIVLNDAPQARLIPEKTKRRIRETAEKLEYQPNPFARSLRSRRSHTIAVMVFDITDPYCTQVLRGVEDTLDRRGYGTFVVDIRNDRARCKRTVAKLLNGQVDGLITIANSAYMDLDLLRVFSERKMPTVVIGRPRREGFNSVAVDNVSGARIGLEHLCSLGHRRIVFMKGPKMLADSEERWAGIQAFAEESGADVLPELVVSVRHRSSSFEEGRQLVRNLLERKRHFTAVMAFDDVMAFGAVRALNQGGLRVPEDCSVLGFDDIAAAAFCNPPLTTIRQPMELMGSLAGDIVLDRLSTGAKQDAHPEVHQRTVPALVLRDSTAAPRA